MCHLLPFLYEDTDMSEANILVVADDPILSRALRTVLVAKGYQVVCIDGSEDTLQLSRSGKYDLVLVDDDLYEGACVEICKSIRSVSEIPLILLDGDAPGGYIADALREIVDRQVRKPFGVSELFACIRETVGKSAAVSVI
jgi:two-component system, OmpR family, KDP operon response regulator KdpE